MPRWKISVTQPGYMEEPPEATIYEVDGGASLARAAFRQEITQTAMAMDCPVPEYREPLAEVMVGSWVHTIELVGCPTCGRQPEYTQGLHQPMHVCPNGHRWAVS